MAVTTEDSTQMGYLADVPAKVPSVLDAGARLRVAYFEFTQGAAAGDAGSYARLCKLPAGRVRLHLPLSRVYTSAMGTGRTMDTGWEAYTNEDGTAVVADPNGLDDGLDVSAAQAAAITGTIGTHETKLFDSKDGVVLTAQINDGTIPAAATISGYFVYTRD